MLIFTAHYWLDTLNSMSVSQSQSFIVCSVMLQMVYVSVVTSAFFYAAGCWQWPESGGRHQTQQRDAEEQLSPVCSHREKDVVITSLLHGQRFPTSTLWARGSDCAHVLPPSCGHPVPPLAAHLPQCSAALFTYCWPTLHFSFSFTHLSDNSRNLCPSECGTQAFILSASHLMYCWPKGARCGGRWHVMSSILKTIRWLIFCSSGGWDSLTHVMLWIRKTAMTFDCPVWACVCTDSSFTQLWINCCHFYN